MAKIERKKYYKKSAETYARMVKELRSTPIEDHVTGEIKKHHIVDGFSAADGFDLRSVSNWTPGQKAKITRYYNEISELLARPVEVYKPRRKDHLKTAQQYAQHEKPLKGLKAALIPVYGKKKPKITFNKKGKIRVAYNGSVRTLINLSPEQIITDLRGELRSEVERNAPHADTFLVQAGKYEIPNQFDEITVGNYMENLQKAYSIPGNHHWTNWMGGVIAFQSEDMFDTADMIQDKIEAGREYRKKRQKERRQTREREERPAKIERTRKALEKLLKQEARDRGKK